MIKKVDCIFFAYLKCIVHYVRSVDSYDCLDITCTVCHLLLYVGFFFRQQVTEIIFVLKAVSTLMDSLKKTQPENGKYIFTLLPHSTLCSFSCLSKERFSVVLALLSVAIFNIRNF